MSDANSMLPRDAFRGKWRALVLLAIAELLAMSLWLSASAVVPQLADAWTLTASEQSWLTMSVQIGFVVGAVLAALWNLPDRVSLPRLIALACVSGAVFNAGIVFCHALAPALALRFLTGVVLASVYPPGMKLVATWTTTDRGLAIGFLVGALAIGTGSPHLFSALSASQEIPADWRTVLAWASGAAALGGVLASRVRVGPLLVTAQRFHWRHATDALRNPAVRLANFGYFGHMWELYAMWTWVPLFILQSYADAGLDARVARVAAFVVVAIGGAGSLIAGGVADRFGRTTVTIVSLWISGTCALIAGWFGGSPYLLTALCVVWGFAVVADSAQFSAAVSELGDPRYVGTALTVQTSLGFLLTMLTIRLVPAIAERAGWPWAFAFLALGPLFGIVAMWRLRRMPEALRMASGNR